MLSIWIFSHAKHVHNNDVVVVTVDFWDWARKRHPRRREKEWTSVFEIFLPFFHIELESASNSFIIKWN